MAALGQIIKECHEALLPRRPAEALPVTEEAATIRRELAAAARVPCVQTRNLWA
jgi:hypothetical protein